MSDRSKKQWQNHRGAQPVSDLVSKLLNPVFERRAGMTMDLIASWEEIVGEQHARNSRPEKLSWPRQATDDDPFEPATLIVACESSHALFLQHESSTIIGRINAYFGFSAVSRMKLVQKPIVYETDKQIQSIKKTDFRDAEKLENLLQEIEDPKLKKALEKMGRGVFSERSDKDD